MKSDTKSADSSRGHVARGARGLPRDTGSLLMLLGLQHCQGLISGRTWQAAE